MSDYTIDYLQYRLERARGALKVAEIAAEAKEYNSCTNRLYYASFYAVNALLMKYNYSSAKHTGVQAIFNKEFIKTGIVPKKYGILFNDLFESRQECDYKDLFFIAAEDIEPLIPKVKEFIEFIAEKIMENIN
ncbi:MAG: HEPN domain-containing protein [Candidatus Cloacimonetes bacterium]|nr:HEPN domain-containing protein [Candidatus Cloacimonadota bacterium]